MIVSPDKHGRLDGTVLNIANQIKTDWPVIPLTKINDFEFNPELYNYKKAVILDYCEYGWDAPEQSNVFGVNSEWKEEQWQKFDIWVGLLDKVRYFRRELYNDITCVDSGFTLNPIEYPVWFSVPEPQTREEFNARKLEVFYFWGYSHEDRRRLHGEIWTNARKHGYMVCDNLFYLNDFFQHEDNPRKWATMNIPHYERQPIEKILAVNGTAKISVSMPGSGKKCFREGESPFNSVMALQKSNVVYTYPWVHNHNCIRLEPGNEIDGLIEALQNPNLYDIYLNGIETAKKYQADNYFKHLESLINE